MKVLVINTHVIPISLRSFSVRVRNILRSMSCSSSTGRYFEKPICSKNSARSYGESERVQTMTHTEVDKKKVDDCSHQTAVLHHTCLWASVGRWRNHMWAYPTVPCSTRVSCIVATMTTFALGVMTLVHSAEAALFTLVWVLWGRMTSVCDLISEHYLFFIITTLSDRFTSLLSTEPSQLSATTWGKPSLLLLLLRMVGMLLSKNGLSSATVFDHIWMSVPGPFTKS